MTSRRVRVPHIAGYETAECGAACLAMVLAKWGCWVPLQEVRDACGVSRDGSDPGSIKMAAEHFGMQAENVLADIQEFEKLIYPCIVHVDLDHYVVMTGFSRRHVWVTDPAGGAVRIPMGAFANRYTGVAIVMCPGEGFRTRRDESGITKRIIDLLRGGGPLLLMIAWLTAIAQGLGLAVPYLNRMVFDHVIPSASPKNLLVAAGLGLAALLLGSMAQLVRNLVAREMRTRLDLGMMRSVVDHLLSLPIDYFLRRTHGSIVSRINMLTGIRSLVGEHAVMVLFDLATAITFFLVLMRSSPWCAPVALLYAALYYLVTRYLFQKISSFFQSRIAASSAAFGVLMEVQQGIETVKAMGAERRLHETWCAHSIASSKNDYEIGEANGALHLSHRVLAEVFVLSTMGIAGLGLVNGKMSIGEFALVLVSARSLVQAVSSISAGLLNLSDIKGRLQGLDDIMSTPSERAGGIRPQLLAGHFEIQHVHFAYGKKSPDVLTGLNFEIRPGEMLGIVGRSGSGKSTLVKILAGLFEPREGRVRIDGVDLGEIDLVWLRSQIGYVLQESFLFDATIGWNITMGTAVDPERMDEACKIAGILEKVRSLPNGYETVIEEGGRLLSGGERQRLTLARALFKKPSVLFLDEASSALDLPTEKVIHNALESLNCTRVVIAHRLDTLKNADRIILLEQGRIAGIGTFDELVAENADFREMGIAAGAIGGAL